MSPIVEFYMITSVCLFIALFVIWTKRDWPNFLLKMGFLVLSVIGVIVVFKLNLYDIVGFLTS